MGHTMQYIAEAAPSTQKPLSESAHCHPSNNQRSGKCSQLSSRMPATTPHSRTRVRRPHLQQACAHEATHRGTGHQYQERLAGGANPAAAKAKVPPIRELLHIRARPHRVHNHVHTTLGLHQLTAVSGVARQPVHARTATENTVGTRCRQHSSGGHVNTLQSYTMLGA